VKVTIDIEPADWWRLATQAEKMQITVADLIREAVALCAKPRERADADDEWVQLHRMGVSIRSIAARYGVDRARVARALREYGEPIGPEPLTDAQIDAITSMSAAGVSAREIERLTGIGRGRIANFLATRQAFANG
jgi:hypothetical protein